MTEGGPLVCRREAFGLPRELHYFNCAYMGPLPRAAEAAGIEAIGRKVVPTRIKPPDDFWTTSDAVRRRFARLIGVDEAQRVAIQPGVSYGVACVARNVRVERGQNIVLTHQQFPGNVYAWRRLAAEAGAEVRMPGPPEAAGTGRPGGTAMEGRGGAWNERLLEAIDARTAVVSVPHVHWTDGTRFDLEAIGARCREVGAVLVVDGTQSIGALPFRQERVGADAVICAAYKWLLGPYSVSFAYFGPRFDDGVPLEETWIARKGSRDFQHLVHYQDEYEPGAVRYDVSERSNFLLLPIALASMDLILEWDPARIQDYCRRLCAELLDEVAEWGYLAAPPEERAHHLFGLRVPEGVDLEALAARLGEHGVSASLRGTALRLSPNVYNDQEDVAALRDALRR